MNKTLVAFTLIIATSFAAITTNTDLSSALSSSSGIYYYGTTNDKVGNSVSNAGDFNKDGVEDMLIGTANEKAYLVFGTSTARTAALDLSAVANAATSVLTFTFASAGSKLPSSFSVVVAAAGDIDKDGYDDVAFGIPTWIGVTGGTNPQADAGLVIVYHGISNTAITTLGASVAIPVDTGASALQTKYFLIKDSSTSAGANKVGTSIASAGDFLTDGNGVDDLIIGAPVTTGFVYVVKGLTTKRQADVDLSSIGSDGAILTGQSAATIGLSVAGLGDVNADNIDDIVIGGNELAYIIYGGSSVATATLAAAGSSSGMKYTYIVGPGSSSFGYNVGAAGDINNDNANDIFIGAPKGGTSNTQGKLYIIPGRTTSGQIADLTALTIVNQIVISGPTAGYLGSASDGGDDINNDGIDDIIACAPGVDLTSPTYGVIVGKCYVMYGKSSFPNVDLSSTTLSTTSSPMGFTISGNAGTGFGTDVSVLGDVSGDSGDDFMISATEASGGGVATAGNVYLFYGVTPTTSTGSGFRLGASLLVFASFFAALIF